MAREFCRNRTYETKPVSHLPREYSFADGSMSLAIDYATMDRLYQCRRMIKEAVLRGDNVGVGEYEPNSEAIEMLFDLSEIFHASDPSSGSVKAFMCIQPCRYQRSHAPCTASVYVFRSKDIDDEVYAELMSLSADFAKDIDIGYTQCFTQVALCLHGLYLQLRRKGFLTVAVLPNWVNITGANLRDSAIMVKDFGLPERQTSSPDVKKMLASYLSTKGSVLKKYTDTGIRQIPGLPKSFPLDNGVKLVIRNARKAEDQLLYDMFVRAAEKGEGYSENEFPSLDMMRLEYLVNGYVAAVEEEETNKLIGFLVYRDSPMSRSGKGKVLEGIAMISAEVRRKGFGASLQSISRFLISSLGYERMLRETFHTSTHTLLLLKRDGVSVCGVLPRGGFQKGVGWVDLALCVHEIENKSNRHLQETIKSHL